MHEAYEFYLLTKLTVGIESLASFGNNILVGTKQGHLLMYYISPRPDQNPEFDLLRYNKAFSKKPITQIAAIPENDVLIKLSDNIISLHELSGTNFALLKPITKTKGATLFTLHRKLEVSLTGENTIFVKMCVAVKRKLQFFYLKNRDFIECGEIILNDEPRAMEWCGKSLCVGFKSSYSIIEVDGNEKIDLFPPGKSLEPTVTKLSDKFVAFGKDTQTKFVDASLKTIEKSSIKWSDLPIRIVYDEPYCICLLRNGVEVGAACDDPTEESKIQLLPIQGAHVACTSKPGLVFIASSDCLWVMSQVHISKQIKILLQEKQFELALKLANISDDPDADKQRNVYQIQTLYAFDLFHNKKFDRSITEFLKLDTDPYEVIRLFPALLPKDTDDVMTDDKFRINDKDMENGIPALINYLAQARQKLQLKPKEEFESRKVQQLMKIIDTTLVKCYLQTNDALVASVLRRNHCHLEETEKTLQRYHKYSELIILYETKGLHKKALELLKQQADYSDSPLKGHERTVQYLQNLGNENISLIFEYASWVLEVQPKDGLLIFTDDLPEVKQLPRPKVLDYFLKTQNHDLVIQYLEHVIHVWKDTNCTLHNALIHQYKELISKLGGEENAYSVKAKLISFLEKSNYYQPDSVLIHFPSDGFFEERAVINGKLGRHEHAIAIYVCLLDNYNQALNYCEKVYSKEGGGDVYLELLRLLISPPDTLPGITVPLKNCTPDLVRALALLEGHPTKLNPILSLAELPDEVPLGGLKRYLTASLHLAQTKRSENQLLRGLLTTQKLMVTEKKMQLESKSFVMAEYRICPICEKRFGNSSAFVRCPNGDVIHYSCQERISNAAL